jgi:hypothetical protein
MFVIELIPPIKGEETECKETGNIKMFQKYVIDKLLKEYDIPLHFSNSYEGGFRHYTKDKPEFRFYGIYINDTYELTRLCSKPCEYYQNEWTEEEVKAITEVVKSYSIVSIV